MNGRTFGDSSGNFNSFQYNGNSVVDYCIASRNILTNVLYFHVHDHIPMLSDHAKITLQLIANFQEVHTTEKAKPMPDVYLWQKESSLLFQQALSSDDVQQKISKFMDKAFVSPNIDKAISDQALGDFNDIIYTACSKSLKKSSKKGKKTVDKIKNQKWFDIDLARMRKKLLSKS